MRSTMKTKDHMTLIAEREVIEDIYNSVSPDSPFVARVQIAGHDFEAHVAQMSIARPTIGHEDLCYVELELAEGTLEEMGE